MKATSLAIVLVLVALLAGSSGAAALEVKAAEEGDLLREGPGYGYGLAATLRSGEPLEVGERRDGWLGVRTAAGVAGWIPVAFVDGLPEGYGLEESESPEISERERRRRQRQERKEARREAERRREQAARREMAPPSPEEEVEATPEPRQPESSSATGKAEVPGGTYEYDPLARERILDEVVAGIYESGPVGPGVVRGGPEPPEEARRVRPEPAERREALPEAPPPEREIAPEESRIASLEETMRARERRLEEARRGWPEMQPPKPGATIVEEVVARVDEDVITKTELDERLRILEKLPDTLGQQDIDPERIRSSLLPRMVDERLLIKRAEDLGVDKERVYQAAKKDFQEKYGIRSDLELISFLEQSGLSLGDFRSIVLRNYLPPLVLEKEVRGRIRVPRDRIESFYSENPALFRVAERVDLAEIVLLRKPGQSERDHQLRLVRVLGRLESGESFAEVARDASDAPSAEEGGDLGIVEPVDLAPSMAQRVGRLVQGELAVEETDYGHHILLLRERRPERTLSLAEVEDRIRRLLSQERYQAELKEYMEKLRRNAYIEVNPNYAQRYGDLGG